MSNGKELKVKYHGNKDKKSKGRKKNPNVASVSKLGYRDDSPYRSLPYIDIHTPDGSIDMSGTGIPLWANGRILPPYSGIHQFDTQTVKEIPLAQDGGDYNMERAKQLYTPDETGHWPSVDYETGEWLKSKEHPTAWMEYLYGYTLNPQQALNYDVRTNPEGYFGDNTLQYVPKQKKGGLTQAQDGKEMRKRVKKMTKGMRYPVVPKSTLEVDDNLIFPTDESGVPIPLYPDYPPLNLDILENQHKFYKDNYQPDFSFMPDMMMRKGGPLTKHQVPPGEVAPFVTSDLNEYNRRKQAYADSLSLYKQTINFYNSPFIEGTSQRTESRPFTQIPSRFWQGDNYSRYLDPRNRIMPIIDMWGQKSEKAEYPVFAEPVQKVIFRKDVTPITPKEIKSIDVPESSPQLITQWDGPTAPATHFMDYENFQPFTAAGYPMIDVRSKKSSVVPKGYEKGSKEEEIYRKRHKTGGTAGWLDKYQTKGGKLGLNNVNTAVASTTSVRKPIIVPMGEPPLPVAFDIVDERKVHPVTGKKINPKRDLKGGRYDTAVIQSIAEQSKKYGLNQDQALDLMGIAFQETMFGKTDDNVGHTLHGDPISGTINKAQVFSPLTEEEANSMSERDMDIRRMIMNYVYNTTIANKPTSDRVRLLQYYNTPYPKKGSVRPSTEQEYHGGKSKAFYSVPVTEDKPLSMDTNPYGLTVLSLRNDLLANNPVVNEVLKRTYKKTGGPLTKHQVPPGQVKYQIPRVFGPNVDRLKYDIPLTNWNQPGDVININTKGKKGIPTSEFEERAAKHADSLDANYFTQNAMDYLRRYREQEANPGNYPYNNLQQDLKEEADYQLNELSSDVKPIKYVTYTDKQGHVIKIPIYKKPVINVGEQFYPTGGILEDISSTISNGAEWLGNLIPDPSTEVIKLRDDVQNWWNNLTAEGASFFNGTPPPQPSKESSKQPGTKSSSVSTGTNKKVVVNPPIKQKVSPVPQIVTAKPDTTSTAKPTPQITPAEDVPFRTKLTQNYKGNDQFAVTYEIKDQHGKWIKTSQATFEQAKKDWFKNKKQMGGPLPKAQIGIPGNFKKKMQDPTYGYGLQWFNDWYSNPETQKRLEQSGLNKYDIESSFYNIGNTQFAQSYPEVMSIMRKDLANKYGNNTKKINKALEPISEFVLDNMFSRGFSITGDGLYPDLIYTTPQLLRNKDNVFPHELIHGSMLDRDIANQMGAINTYINPKLKEFYPDLYKEAKKTGNKELINEMFENVRADDEYGMLKEIYPYVQSLRYELGVKPGDVITDEMLNKYKNDYEENAKQFPQRHRSGDSDLDRLLKMYSKPKLIQFMNTVAENKQPGMDMPMAKRGGLPKHQVAPGEKKDINYYLNQARNQGTAARDNTSTLGAAQQMEAQRMVLSGEAAANTKDAEERAAREIASGKGKEKLFGFIDIPVTYGAIEKENASSLGKKKVAAAAVQGDVYSNLLDLGTQLIGTGAFTRGINYAPQFQDRWNFIKNLEKEGYIGDEFSIFDRARAASSTAKTEKLTKKAIDHNRTAFRDVQGVIHPNTPLDELENMRKAGVDLNDPISIAEYQATHVPMHSYGQRYYMPQKTSKHDVLYAADHPAEYMYGDIKLRINRPADYSTGSYADWYDTYLKRDHLQSLYPTASPSNSNQKIWDALASGDITIDKGSPISLFNTADNRTLIGERGQKLWDIDRSWSPVRLSDLEQQAKQMARTGPANKYDSDYYAEMLKKMVDEHRAGFKKGWRNEWRKGGPLPKAQYGTQIGSVMNTYGSQNNGVYNQNIEDASSITENGQTSGQYRRQTTNPNSVPYFEYFSSPGSGNQITTSGPNGMVFSNVDPFMRSFLDKRIGYMTSQKKTGGPLVKAQKGIPQAAAPSPTMSENEEITKAWREYFGIPTKPNVSKKELEEVNKKLQAKDEFLNSIDSSISNWKSVPIWAYDKAFDYGVDIDSLWEKELAKRQRIAAENYSKYDEAEALRKQADEEYGRTIGDRIGDLAYNMEAGWAPFGLSDVKWRRRPTSNTEAAKNVYNTRIAAAAFDKMQDAEAERLSAQLPWWKDFGPLNTQLYSEQYSNLPWVSKDWRGNLYHDTMGMGQYMMTDPSKGPQPFDIALGAYSMANPYTLVSYATPGLAGEWGQAPYNYRYERLPNGLTVERKEDNPWAYFWPSVSTALTFTGLKGLGKTRPVKPGYNYSFLSGRGYWKGPKPPASSTIIDTPGMLPGSSNAVRTNYMAAENTSSGGIEELLRRLKGEDLKPITERQTNAINEGLGWLRNWYSNPETLRRWKALDFGKSAKLNRQLRRLESDDISNIIDISERVPRRNKVVGSYYPGDKANAEELLLYPHHPYYSELTPGVAYDELASVMGHEGTHFVTRGEAANKYISPFTEGVINVTPEQKLMATLLPDEFVPGLRMKGESLTYHLQPDEIYARINEIRKGMNLAPGENVTAKAIKDFIEKSKAANTALGNDFSRLNINYNVLAKAINTLPAAGGAGWLFSGMTGEGQSQLQKQRVGGPIRKFQVPPGEMPAEGPVRPVTIPMIEAGINMPEVTSAPEPTDARTSFSQAFREARNAGLKEFVWRGKRYGTKYRSEMQPAAPKAVQPSAPAPAPFDMAAAAARPASTESISTSNYGNYANMLASTWMTRNRMTPKVINTPKTLPNKTQTPQRQVDRQESQKLGIVFGKNLIPTREERMRQAPVAPVTPTTVPSEFAPVARPTSQMDMYLQQMRNRIANQPSPEQQAAEYTAMFPPSPVSSPMPEWAMNMEMANAIKNRNAQAPAPVESSIPEWAMTPEMVTAIRKRNLQTQTPIQQPMPEWATDSSLVNAVNNMKRDVFLASQAEGPAGMPMSDADKLIAQVRQNVGQQPSEQEQLAMYEQMMQAMRQSRPKVEQPAPGAPYSVVVTDPNASQTMLPIHAAEGLKYPVSGQAQQMYGFDYGDAILSGLGNAWEGVKDFGEDVVNQTMDFSKNIAEQTAEMLGQPNEERIKQIDKLSKELNKVDDSIQKLYYDATNPDSKTKKESENKLEKVYEERKNLITQLNESKADIGFIDRNLNKLLQDNGEYAAAVLKALHKGISINEKQFGIVDELSETGFELPRLETYGEKKEKEDEQHKQSNWIDDLDTSKHPFVRWKYRINASNEKPMLVTVHGTRGERDANQYLPADIQAEGTVGHFLDQNPISGYMHPNTANMFKSLAEDDYVGKLESTDQKDVYAVKFVKRKTLPKDFAKMTKNAFVIRQDKFDDIDFDKKITDTNFGGHTYWYNKTKKNRAVPVSSGPDPNTYDYTSGGNVYFIFEYKGKTKYIPFAGSPNEIRKEGEKIKKDYKLDKGKLVISMADAGSYGSSIRSDQTTKRITNTLLNDKGHGYFNRNSFTGSGMSFVGFKK